MSAFQSILVPLDGSTYSVQALAFAELFARKTDAMVHLVMVHQPAPIWFTPPEVLVDTAALDAAASQRESAYLEGVAYRFWANSDLQVRHQLLEGEIPAVIDAYATTQGVDLVVMTTHGHRGLPRLWLGSTADKLIRGLSVPVLVVHPTPDSAIVPPQLRRILVPLDGSSLSASAVDQARSVALMHKAELVLAMIVDSTMADQLPEAQRYLDTFRNRLRREGVRVESRVVMGHKVAKRIADLAGREHCDLILMATHGMGGLDRLFFDSVTDQVVRNASIPVLVLRPGDPVPAYESQYEVAAELIGAAPSCSIG